MTEGERAGEGTAALPLRPGDEHAILFDRDAERFARSVNYVAGDDILLHLILRAAEDVLVANDLLDGAWGAECRLPLAGARGAEGVRVRVVVAEDGFLIGVSGAKEVAFRPRRGMAGPVELRAAPGVTVTVRGGEEQGPAALVASPPAATAGAAGNRIGVIERRARAEEARMAALEAAIGQPAGDAGARPEDAALARIPAALLEGIGLQAPAPEGRQESRWLGRHAAIVLRERVPAREISLGVAAVARGLDREGLFCTLNGIRADHRWLNDGRGGLALRIAIPEGGDLGGMVGVLRLSFEGAGAAAIACSEVILLGGGGRGARSLVPAFRGADSP